MTEVEEINLTAALLPSKTTPAFYVLNFPGNHRDENAWTAKWSENIQVKTGLV